jgi:hypothetical protein
MGKTILELFKSKKLDTGTTAAGKYDVRNSKDIPVSSASGILSPSFGLLNKLRKSGLSLRDSETFVEQETTGLRPLRVLAAPQIYGTELIRLTRRSTNMLDDMKNGTYKDGDKNRIVGVGIYKIKEKAKTLASKIGIAFPEEIIPTRLSINEDFKSSAEHDIPQTLQKIKGDVAGNLVGKFLAQNVKGTPKQIGNAVVGNLIQLGKNEVRKKLVGGRKEGQKLFAEKDENQIQYNSYAPYSATIDVRDTIDLRNDLSTLLNITGGDPQSLYIVNTLTQDKRSKLRLGQFAASVNQKNQKPDFNRNIAGLSGTTLITGKQVLPTPYSEPFDLFNGKKSGQIELGRKLIESNGKTSILKYDPDNPQTTNYSNTIDATDEEASRNDLSSYLQRTQTLATFSNLGDKLTEIGIGNRGVPLKRVKQSYNKANLIQSIESKQKIARDGIALNQKSPYNLSDANEKNRNKYDGLDFITVRFKSIPTGKAVNFLATITGVTEDITPAWDSNKFLGSPFEYYTYSSISRGVTFNLKLFSLNSKEHVVMWEKINLLTSFTYPAEYQNSTYVIPPFLKLTIGDLYKNKECFIDSLTYTVDDNAGWEIGTNYSTYGVGGGTSITKDGRPNSIDKGLNNYKLPLVIDVSVRVKFVETKANTISNFYGFDSIMPKNIIEKIEQKEIPQNTSKEEVSPTDISKRKIVNPINPSQTKQTDTSNLGMTATNNPLERAIQTGGVPLNNQKDLSTKSNTGGGSAIGGAYN